MINKDRIVPIQKIDLLSLIGTILNLAGTSYTGLAADNIDGDFTVPNNDQDEYLANQPVKTLNFPNAENENTVYFVAAYDYEGIKVAGAEATIAEGSVTVKNDAATLYKAVLASGSVTITAVTPEVA